MISPTQLLCILLLSRISSEIVFPSYDSFGGEALITLAASEAVCFLLALPVIVYSAKGNNFYGAAAKKNHALGLVAGYGTAFLTSYLAAHTALHTAEFAQRGLVTGMSGAVLAVLVGAFAVYAAFKGIEAISRAGLLFAAAAVLLTAAIVFADIPHMQLKSFDITPPDTGLIGLTAKRLMRCGEYLVFAAVLPYVRRPERGSGLCAAVLIYALSSLVLTMLLQLFNMAVLGEFYGLTEFPFTAASGLADITLFKRLDGFAAAIWSACAGLRCGLFLFSGYAAIKSVLSHKAPAPAKGETA